MISLVRVVLAIGCVLFLAGGAFTVLAIDHDDIHDEVEPAAVALADAPSSISADTPRCQRLYERRNALVLQDPGSARSREAIRPLNVCIARENRRVAQQADALVQRIGGLLGARDVSSACRRAFQDYIESIRLYARVRLAQAARQEAKATGRSTESFPVQPASEAGTWFGSYFIERDGRLRLNIALTRC